MAGNRKSVTVHLNAEGPHGDEFPATESGLLREAAAGRWERFVAEYLRPCWREVLIACRTRRIRLADTEDVFQELLLRLMQEGRLNSRPGADPEGNEAEPFFGNVPARYLKYRESSPQSAQFRTVLKSVIRNLILEHLRRNRRSPQLIDVDECAKPGGWIDETVSSSVERVWITHCLREAAERLKRECAESRTRGKHRIFDVLARSLVQRESPAAIAAALTLDRTTISDLLVRARERFVQILQDVAGVEDFAELKQLVAAAPESLIDAVRQAQLGSIP